MTEIIRSFKNQVFNKDVKLAASIGKFDGLHLGHQKILNELSQKKKDWELKGYKSKSIVFSFYPHPLVSLGKVDKIPLILTLRQKLRILKEYKIDYLYLIHFTKDFSKLTADKFLEDFFIKGSNLDYLAIGKDACIGKAREGDSEFIKKKLSQNNIEVDIVNFENYLEDKVSSALIRKHILNGKVEQAAKLLNRNYSIESSVFSGDQRGEKIGFPTLNVKLNKQTTPQNGVYASKVKIDGELYNSVTNIGVRPTFGENKLQIESHVINEKLGNLYGKKIELFFIKKIRDENKFSSLEELIEQIKKDINSSIKILDN